MYRREALLHLWNRSVVEGTVSLTKVKFDIRCIMWYTVILKYTAFLVRVPPPTKKMISHNFFYAGIKIKLPSPVTFLVLDNSARQDL